jgi:hypothetical protein
LKSGLTNTISNLVLDQVDGAVSKPAIKTEYYSDTQSTWKSFDTRDIESRTLNLENQNNRYQVHSFLPPAKTINLLLNNFDQQYSTGSGNPKATILKKNLLIRAWSGYDVGTASSQSTINDDFTSHNKFFHTQLLGGKVYNDSATESGNTFATASGITSYGGTLGGGSYSPEGYYIKRFNLPLPQAAEPLKMQLAVSDNNMKFKYRVSQYEDMAGGVWSTFSSMATGTNTKTLAAGVNDNYIQYLVSWHSGSWNTATCLNTATLFYEDNETLFKQGVFITDEPKFGEKVNITGRDYLRKALETQINLPTITGNAIGTVIERVLDRTGIPYDVSNWDITSTTVTLDGTAVSSLNNQSGYKVLDKLMDALNAGNDDWQFQFNDLGQGQLKKIPTATEADDIIHYHFNIENISKDFDSDKQLQRVTAVNKDIIVNAESTLGNFTGTTSGTSLSLTYTDALYVRYSDANDIILSETARGNTGVSFSVNSGVAYDINVFGCTPKNAITSEIWAERGNSNNIKLNDGDTFKNVNPFFNQTMAGEYSDYIIGKFGDPALRVQLTQFANPLIELNDNLLVFDKDTFSDTIMGLRAINESWSNPGYMQNLTLIDKGVAFGISRWDRNGIPAGINNVSGINDIVWASLVWDYDLGPTATSDPDSYENTKKVGFT